MIRKSGSPLPVGSVASQSTSACGGQRAGPVAVALAVAGVRVADVVAVGALRLEVVDDDGEPRAGRVLLERLRQRRPALRVDEARVDGRVEDLERADRRDDVGPVDQADLDRVGADRRRCRCSRRARAEHRVEPGDDARRERVDAGRVLELVEADDVARRARPAPGAACRAGAVELGCGWSASAPRQSRLALPPHGPGPVSLAVVSSVRKKLSVFIAATRSVPPTGSGRRRARVRRGVVGRAGREDPVEAEVEAEDADRVLRRGRRRGTGSSSENGCAVRVPQDRRVLGALVVVERDPAEAVRQRCGRSPPRPARRSRCR